MINGSCIHDLSAKGIPSANVISPAKYELLTRALQINSGIQNPTQNEVQTYFDVPYDEMEKHTQLLKFVSCYRNMSPRNNPPRGFLGNWSDTFRTLIPGTIAVHTPENVIFASYSGLIISGGTMIFSGKIDDVRLKAPLRLSVNSTLSEFIAALTIAGIYNN